MVKVNSESGLVEFDNDHKATDQTRGTRRPTENRPRNENRDHQQREREYRRQEVPSHKTGWTPQEPQPHSFHPSAHTNGAWAPPTMHPDPRMGAARHEPRPAAREYQQPAGGMRDHKIPEARGNCRQPAAGYRPPV